MRVPAGLNVSPQSLTQSHHFESFSVWPVYDRGLCTQFDSVMHVIGVNPCPSLMFVMSVIVLLSCQSLMFGMPVLGVCKACHQWTKYLFCLVVTKWCVVTFASRFFRSTSLDGNKWYSTEMCLLMNSWNRYSPVEWYTRMSQSLYDFCFNCILTGKAG